MTTDRTLRDILLPKGIELSYLRAWADQYERESGVKANALSVTLRHLAEAIPAAERAEDDLRHDLRLNAGMLARQTDLARAAEHDRDAWKQTAANLQREMDERSRRPGSIAINISAPGMPAEQLVEAIVTALRRAYGKGETA